MLLLLFIARMLNNSIVSLHIYGLSQSSSVFSISKMRFKCNYCQFSKLFSPAFRLSDRYGFEFNKGIIKNVITSGIVAERVISSPQTISCSNNIYVSSSLFINCKNLNSPGGAILCICNFSDVSIDTCTFEKCSSYGTFNSGSRSKAGGGAIALHCLNANITNSVFSYCYCVGIGPSFYIGCPIRQNASIGMVSLFCTGSNHSSEGNTWCIDRASASLSCINNTSPNVFYHSGGHVGYSSEYSDVRFMLVKNSAAVHIYGNSLSTNSSTGVNDHCSFVNLTAYIAIFEFYPRFHSYSNCVFSQLTGNLISKNHSSFEFVSCIFDTDYASEPATYLSCVFTDSVITDLPMYCVPDRLIEPSKTSKSHRFYYLFHVFLLP